MPQFQKGEKRPPNAGRKRGSVNKTTSVLREAALLAAQLTGDPQKRGSEGLVDYLMFAAREYPPAFLALLGRMVPQEVLVDAQAEISYRSVAEIDRELASRGFPIEEIARLLTQASQVKEQDPGTRTAPPTIRRTAMTEYPPRIVDLAIERACAQARENFSDFRRLMRPDLKWGWWTQISVRSIAAVLPGSAAGQTAKTGGRGPATAWKIPGPIGLHSVGRRQEPASEDDFRLVSAWTWRTHQSRLQRLMRSPRYVQTFGRTHIGGPAGNATTR